MRITLISLFISYLSFAQQTYVPDDNFEQALIDLGYDDVLNDYVVTNNINSIEIINLAFKEISDLTGIEDFVSLKNLHAGSNNLTEININTLVSLEGLYLPDNDISEIDISSNSNLKVFYLPENNVSQIDFSQNPVLSGITLDYNPLTEIDFSNNPLIESIWILGVQLSELDISNLSLLKSLALYGCNLSEIDISNNPLLTNLNAELNPISELDTSNNPQLTYLYLSSNNLVDLNIENNLLLKTLRVTNTQIESFDLSNHADLEWVILRSNNNLEALNIKNGNNQNIDPSYFDIRYTNLDCVQVDNPAYSYANWTNKDSETVYSTDCENMSTNENSDDFIRVYPNPVENLLSIQNSNPKINQILIFDLSGKIILNQNLTVGTNQINVKNLPKGMYVVQIKSDNQIIKTEKIIKN